MFDSVLVCPKCKSDLENQTSGFRCRKCSVFFPLIGNIPRFIFGEDYTDSFGLQWNRFSRTQLDSVLGSTRSKLRFEIETQWSAQDLKDKIVLDAGCGAGRFAEVAQSFGATLIAVDSSRAVEAAAFNLKSDSIFILQADLLNLPLSDRCADFVYCIGVLQHTAAPRKIVEELFRCLKVGGEITFTFYENSSWHVKFYSKYLVRPITKRLPKSLLLSLIENSAFVWFPLTRYLFSLPYPVSKILRFLIPIANYVEWEYQNLEDAKSEAILDTFDMLSPTYDSPIRKSELISWVSALEFKVTILPSTPPQGTLRFRRDS